MIQITCDKCERAFAVDEAEAGGKLPCPMCGDINRIPARGVAETNRAGDRVTEERSAGAKSASAGGDADGTEKEIRVVRPAMVRAHPLRFLVIVILVVGGIVGAVMSWNPEKPWLSYGSLVLTVLGLLWLAKWWIATYLWIKITITNKRTIRHEGIIRRHSTEVMHDHVRSVDINQNFAQRLCRVGYIGIDSAGQDGIEIEIRDIPDPYGIKKLIDQYRKM